MNLNKRINRRRLMMRGLKNKYVGLLTLGSILACTHSVQASTNTPQLQLNHHQTSSNKVNIDLVLQGLTEDVVAVEVGIVADDIKGVDKAEWTLKNAGYHTYQLKSLSDNKEQLITYMVSEDKNTPIVSSGGSIGTISFALETSGKLTIDEDKLYVKVIGKDYTTDLYEDVKYTYTEGSYTPDNGGNNNKPDNGGDNTPNTDDGNNNNKPDNGGNNKPNTGGGSNTNKPNNGGGSNNNKPSSGGNSNHDKPNGGVEEPTTDNNTNTETNTEAENPIIVNFSDLENHWAKASIYNMASKGIIKGYEDGTFKPNASITRGEFATLLARAFEIKGEMKHNPFNDVQAGKWYTEGIIALYESGITSGRADGSFGVNDAITNEEISAMLYRTLTVLKMDLIDVNEQSINFKDEAKISNYAKEAVQALSKKGIVNGKPDGTFGPKDSTSRAQVAVMLDRIFQLAAKSN